MELLFILLLTAIYLVAGAVRLMVRQPRQQYDPAGQRELRWYPVSQ